MRRKVLAFTLVLFAPITAAAQTADSVAVRASATRLLALLEGRWEGRAGGAAADSTRVISLREYRLSNDSLLLSWTDSVIGGPTGRGTFAFSPRTGHFYYLGTYAPFYTPIALRGRLDPRVARLSLTPFAPSPGSEWNQSLDASELRAVAADSHVWARWDNGWIVNFRRLR